MTTGSGKDTPPSAWLVIPTFNEAPNVERVLRAADAVLAREAAGCGHRILVVDDASPDGTAEIADAVGAELGTVEVLRRPARAGLGGAYLAGFGRALDAGAGFVFEMDADLSHDPEDLARLLAVARGGAGIALGSRYAEGGSIADWGPLRRMLSRGGSLYSRVVLGVRVRDLTGGFKCFRAEVLRAIDLPTVRSEGYAFQVELTYRALRCGFDVVEVPIVFRDRREGASKMNWRIAAEAVRLVPAIRGWTPPAAGASR